LKATLEHFNPQNGRFLANGRQMKSLKKMKTESAKIALKNGALLG